MEKREPTREELFERIRTLEERLLEAEQAIEAIQSGEVDAFVVHKADGEQLYTLTGADHGYRVLVESISEGALILSSDDSIYYCNRTLGEMLGLPNQKIISTKLDSYIASEDREQTVELIKASRGCGAAKGELLMKRNDGTLLPVNVSLNCMRVEDFEGVCAVVTDLSEQKQVEEELRRNRTELQGIELELRRSEERLRQNVELLQKVVDGITDPLFMLDKEGLVTTINKAAMDYFGATDDTEFFGRPCFLGLRGRENACPGCSYPFASVNKKPVTFERKGLIDPRKVESVTVYPVFNDFGEQDAVIVKTSDVTQVKILERQIFHNEKLASLGLIASGIAHEINNPNSFIHFNIPILKKYLDELMPILDDYAALHPDFKVLHMSYAELKEDVYKLLRNMAHGSQRITKIVGTLKSFVRKRDQEGLQKIDLKQLIDKVVALCHAEIRRTVKSFEVLAPGELPPVVSDPEALEQVLLNLLINAVHACDKEDSRMSLKVGQGYLGTDDFFIEVTDNGSGIEETIRNRIFDPFFTTKSGSIGTGLGLYICHQHVASLGGSIEVESRVGEGTTFRVLLPQTDKK